MRWDSIDCVMPPMPELNDEIVAAKQRLVSGANLADAVKGTRIDARSLTLILSRPKQTRAHTLVSPSIEAASVTGGLKALVLLVDFSDQAATQSQNHFHELLFSRGTFATGSMRDYYQEVSYNKLDVTGAVSGSGGVTSGWYRAPEAKSYYTAGNYGFGSYPRNAQKLVEDVVDMARPHVDFSQYDNDNDGVVDALVVICAGTGGEASGNVNHLWSHKWNVSSPISVNGVKVVSYFMAPEDGRVGVMAHELGHLLLKLPDLYDTDYTSAGTGRWDLMAGGSWNDKGNTPAHPTAWCKVRVGWVNPVTIFDMGQNVTIKPYADNGDIYKLPVGNVNSKEYFLISNRRKTKYDKFLPGEGLLIEHVDENQLNNTDENHYLVDIEQADGRRDLNKNANRGDAEDVFPAGGKTSFTATTSPDSKSYSGADSGVKVTNIAQSGNDITAHLQAGKVTVTAEEWVKDVNVTSTYASHHSQNAWVALGTLGWRKINLGAPDGVTNVFTALVEAQANERKVDVLLNDQMIYRVVLL